MGIDIPYGTTQEENNQGAIALTLQRGPLTLLQRSLLPVVSKENRTMSEQVNVKAAHAFFDAWNAGDLNKVEDSQADDFKAEGPGAAGPMSRAQNRSYLENFLTAFPGSQFEEQFTITQGDYVVTHWKISGTHSGPLYSPSGNAIPPTGKHVTLSGTLTWEVKNGKVARTWAYWDMASLLSQIGLLPPM